MTACAMRLQWHPTGTVSDCFGLAEHHLLYLVDGIVVTKGVCETCAASALLLPAYDQDGVSAQLVDLHEWTDDCSGIPALWADDRCIPPTNRRSRR